MLSRLADHLPAGLRRWEGTRRGEDAETYKIQYVGQIGERVVSNAEARHPP